MSANVAEKSRSADKHPKVCLATHQMALWVNCLCGRDGIILSVCSCARLLRRMRCADIQADGDPDGEWISAKAVFDGAVSGAVALVRA